ncbi:flippase [Mucilaginibacter sp.]
MKNIKKNYTYNIILTLTNILFPIITFPYVSRLIGPVGVGKIQFIVSLSQYFALFAGLGIPIYGTREIAKYKNDKEKLSKSFSELIAIYLIVSIGVSVVYLLIILNVSFFAADKNLYLLSLTLVLFGFSSIDWLYSGLEEFKIISLRSVFIKIISVVAVFIFIKTAADYKNFLYISIFSILGNNIINLLFVKKRVNFILKALDLKKHLKPLLYIFSTTVATSMYTVLDTVLLGFLSSTKAIGFYTAAVKLTKISLPFIISIGTVTIPAISKSFYDNNDSQLKSLLQKSFNFIVFFSVPISMGTFLMAKEFIIIFSGKGFLDAVVPMQILSFLPILIGLGFFYGFQVLVPASKDKELFKSVMIGMAAGLILNFLLVPKLNATGEALANVLTELIVTICYFAFVKRHNLIVIESRIFIQSIISSLFFIPVCIGIRLLNFDILTELIITIIVCGFVYGLVQLKIFKNSMSLQLIESIKQRIIKI